MRVNLIAAAWGLLAVSTGLLSTEATAQLPGPPVIMTIDGVPVPISDGNVPLSASDPIFANARSSGPLTLSSGQSRSDLEIVDQAGTPSITCRGSCDLQRIRIQSREGVRCTSGTINLTWLLVEATGVGSDHADGLQCYSPGSTGVVTVKNTTFKTGGSSTAGYFSADNWRGEHIFENVLFWGGNHGLRINSDGGSSARLKNVYFVRGSFQYAAFQIDVPILQWENVRWVTIENGRLVMGEEIARPR